MVIAAGHRANLRPWHIRRYLRCVFTSTLPLSMFRSTFTSTPGVFISRTRSFRSHPANINSAKQAAMAASPAANRVAEFRLIARLPPSKKLEFPAQKPAPRSPVSRHPREKPVSQNWLIRRGDCKQEKQTPCQNVGTKESDKGAVLRLVFPRNPQTLYATLRQGNF